MRHWLCCDGGGTKLIMMLVDEELSIVYTAKAEGINPNFISKACIRANIGSCVSAIAQGFPGLRVEACLTSMPCPAHYLQEALSAHGINAEVVRIGEGLMGIMAGIGVRHGFAALSGTGSDVFYTGSAGAQSLGGWGMLLGDEGSGGYIGQMGLIAAIRALEGWGEPTTLTDQLAGWLRLGEPITPASARALVERVYGASSPRAVLASFAPAVSAAGDAGDAQAGAILTEAGTYMGRQMAALIARVKACDPDCLSLPSTLCGGVWKGSRRIYRAYREHLLAVYPGFDIRWPRYDAIAGGAVMIGLDLGYTKEEINSRMAETFRDYLYPEE